MPTLVSESKTIRRELWTADDFLAWLEPGIHADLIDGEKSMHSPVSLRHADLTNFLDRLLAAYIDKHRLGRLYREVVAVRLGSRNVFLPDLAFIPAAKVPLLTETHIPFAPALVVEVLSPRTADRDVGPKFAAYEEHGVDEYWVLDPQTLDHRFYRREGDFLTAFADDEEVVRSGVVTGFHFRRGWLDPENLPGVAACLETIEAATPADPAGG
jgi:Uma2 family endonuclease